jgi:hypothetical protein
MSGARKGVQTERDGVWRRRARGASENGAWQAPRRSIQGRFAVAGGVDGASWASAAGAEGVNGSRAGDVEVYPGARRATTSANSSCSGWLLESNNLTRRVLRRTTAPIFSKRNRMVPA